MADQVRPGQVGPQRTTDVALGPPPKPYTPQPRSPGPGTGPLSQGLSPFEVAAAYRAENPGLFDDLDDSELITALRDEDPDTYALIDPLLHGAEHLTPGALKDRGGRSTVPIPDIPAPQGPKANPVISTGLRVAPALIGGVAGAAAGGPVGAMAGGAAGSGLGETVAQAYETTFGEREQFSVPAIALETGLGAVNPGLRGASTAARVGWQALYGSGLGAAGNAARPVVEEGRLPTGGEIATGATVGALLGGGIGGAVEIPGAARRAVGATDALTMGLPDGGPPIPPAGIDLAPIRQAADVLYQQEEARLAAQLTAVFPGSVPPAGGPDFHTVTQQKQILSQLAQLTDEQKAVSAMLQPPPSGIEALGPPPPPGPPVAPLSRQLPAQAGVGASAPNAIRAYPAEGIPDELIPANVDPLGVQPPPPPPLAVQAQHPLEAAIETSLSAPPAPPRLTGNRVLRLTAEGPPPAPPVPRGTLPRPRVPTEGPITQGARMGGRPATDQQPRLPGSDQPRPLDNRPYAEGPNAGPRRPKELHAVPRKAVRYVDTPEGRKREVYDSPVPAEDPATYPPEVRRELATIAWELEQFPHERVQGGLTQAQLQALQDELNTDVAGAIAELKKRGATAGGAIPGAPVYHEVIKAAQGGYQHISRAEMLRAVREALLDGKGSGVSDAAAVVARTRIEHRLASPERLPNAILARYGDEGDAIINWVDEDGTPTALESDLDDVTRTVRETETAELKAALELQDQLGGELSDEARAYFDAAQTELVRRGVLRPHQPGLVMEAPGGAKGPSLFDFEGGAGPQTSRAVADTSGPPPPPPGKSGPNKQPELPGTEAVRTTENPTPAVTEVPFALTPPPPPPAPKARGGRPRLLQLLEDEEGVLVFDIPAGDRAGLRKWLKAQEAEHGGETWFSRAEAAADAGDWDRAFKVAATASAHSYARAYSAAKTRQEEWALESAVRGTPLQADIRTEIISAQRQRAGVGDAPPVPDFPPSPRVSQAGAARGRARLGPAGILDPGPRQRPLSSAAPALRAATLDREVTRLITEGVDEIEGLATIPGNRDTYLRLFRQIGEQVYRGQNLRLLREAGVRIPPEELAQHYNATITDAARTLNLLSQFAQTHAKTLTEAAEGMSMGGALAGMVGGPPPRYVGAGGRTLSPSGQKAAQAVVDQVADQTSRYQAAALANDMQKRRPISGLQMLHDASYAWMLSKWNTAVRNYVSFTGRYSVDSLDHALTLPIARLLGDESTVALSKAQLAERGLQPIGKAGTAVTPTAAWADDLQTLHNFTIDSINSLPPADARRALRLLLDLPPQAAEYLGTVGGEDLVQAFSDVPVMRHLVNPKVQRVLTMFNRAQEFSARATVFDASVRAQLRAQGLDPTAVLARPTPAVIAAVGGQQKFEDLLFTATSQALEATYAGRTSKDSIPGALIRFINAAWPLKLGVPFPRFNFSAAPRWLYDHSPAALLDLVRFPFDRAGITAAPGTAGGGRLYRGVRAQEITQTELPLLRQQIAQAERQQGTAIQDLLATQREWAVRQRQVARLEARAQQGLPGTATALEQATQARDRLLRQRERLKATMKEQRTVVGDLRSQEKKLLSRVEDATAINAPNYSQWLARMGVGTVGLLGAAWVVRAQDGAKGTRWYEYRVDREGKEPIILDFRPFAPFAQYLFVADVLQDFYTQTNWEAVRATTGSAEEGLVASPLDWTRAIWENYEGKYTEAELGAQFAQAFLSISRAAGTTLTLTDLLTNMDVPSLEEAGRAIVGTIGQFFSRFTVPGQQISDVVGQFDPEEAKVRTPPKTTVEDWERPLAGPIANVPFARRLIPERISQTTGQPVAAEFPLLRALAGISGAPRDFVTEEVRRIGVPGSSVFIRETGDYALDRLVAETYSRLLQQELPIVLEDPSYTELGTPARQRDYLQRYIFPALKRAALAETRDALGTEQFEGATVRGEAARRKLRQQRMLDALEGDSPAVPADDPAAAPAGPPPPPPF